MRFWDIVMVAASTPTPVAEGPSDLWPLTGMGASGDWTFGSAIFFDTNRVVFEEAPEGEAAALTGAALTAFDAAISNSTPYSVTITVTGYGGSDVEISMKGGAFVAMDASGNGQFTKTITSGAGSGFVIRAMEEASLAVSGVEIEA